jgi:hypothetical protein
MRGSVKASVLAKSDTRHTARANKSPIRRPALHAISLRAAAHSGGGTKHPQRAERERRLHDG